MDSIHGIDKAFPASSGSINIDYDVDKIVCAAGYAGWMRKANESYDADEIMLCPRVRQTLLQVVNVEDIKHLVDEQVYNVISNTVLVRMKALTQDPLAAQQQRRDAHEPQIDQRPFQFSQVIKRENQKLKTVSKKRATQKQKPKEGGDQKQKQKQNQKQKPKEGGQKQKQKQNQKQKPKEGGQKQKQKQK